MIHKRVMFRGEEYWYHRDPGDSFCEAMLAPLDHYNDSGDLLADPLRDLCYAIVEGDNIMRFSEKIGEISEIKDV